MPRVGRSAVDLEGCDLERAQFDGSFERGDRLAAQVDDESTRGDANVFERDRSRVGRGPEDPHDESARHPSHRGDLGAVDSQCRARDLSACGRCAPRPVSVRTARGTRRPRRNSRQARQSPLCGMTAYSARWRPCSWGPSSGSGGPAGFGRSCGSVRERNPTARRTVSATALPPSTSSYSSSPSWISARPAVPSDASTKRRDGNVGSPNSWTPPSAVRPRLTTANAHSASEPSTGAGSGKCAREPMVARVVVDLVRHPQESLTGA